MPILDSQEKSLFPDSDIVGNFPIFQLEETLTEAKRAATEKNYEKLTLKLKDLFNIVD